MTIQTLCTRCGVTKKAVTYAVEQGLLTPGVQENGYRVFTEEDAVCMEKIATLRALGLSTGEIRMALNSRDWTALCRAQTAELAMRQEKQRILLSLSQTGDWQTARRDTEAVLRRVPITERLKLAFPGPFGAFLAAHFAPYLTQPIHSAKQQEAWETMTAWLDGTSFTVPEDLAEACKMMTAQLTPEMAEAVDARMADMLRDHRAYLRDHAEEIARWQKIRASREYRESAAGRLEQHLRSFLSQSGYNTVFIPAMRRLSPEYDDHQRRLEVANAEFVGTISEKTEETPPCSCILSKPVVQ